MKSIKCEYLSWHKIESQSHFFYFQLKESER